jgi:pimeloyl-[acyl-carrier protein] synthase
VWIVTRYDDVVAAAGHEELSNDLTRFRGYDTFAALLGGYDSPEATLQRSWLSQTDPPEHTRLQRVIAKALNAQLARVRPAIRELVANRMRRCADQQPHDLVAEFAHPVAINAIHNALGLPEEDRGIFEQWALERAVAVQPRRTSETNEASRAAAAGLSGYFRSLLHEPARVRPGAVASLIASLRSGELQTAEEFIGACTLLVAAGHEAAANLLASSLHALAVQPCSMPHSVLSAPASLATLATELARFASPIQFATRITRTAVQFGDGSAVIPPGHIVLLGLGSANRDQRRFHAPDTIVVDRHPNPHLAFGQGRHACPGWRMAMFQLEETLRVVLDRRLEMTVTRPPVWQSDLILRGLRQCVVTTTAGKPDTWQGQPAARDIS